MSDDIELHHVRLERCAAGHWFARPMAEQPNCPACRLDSEVERAEAYKLWATKQNSAATELTERAWKAERKLHELAGGGHICVGGHEIRGCGLCERDRLASRLDSVRQLVADLSVSDCSTCMEIQRLLDVEPQRAPHEHEWIEVSTMQDAADLRHRYVCRCGASKSVLESDRFITGRAEGHAHSWRVVPDDQNRVICDTCGAVESAFV